MTSGRSSSSRLFEVRDLARIPAWFLSKPAYSLLPISIHLRLAKLLGTFDSLRSPLRHDVLAALEAHLGAETSERELRSIARHHFQFRRKASFVRLWPQVRNFATLESIEVDGLDRLDEALAGGNGVIVVTAHFGYARLIKPILRVRGYEPSLVGRIQSRLPSPHTRVGRFVHTDVLRLPSLGGERRKEAVGEDLPAGVNLRPHLAALARNAVLVILADGRSARALSRVPVLGIDVRFAPGAVSLGRATGAPVMPAFVVDEHGHGDAAPFRLVIQPPLELQRTHDARADHEGNLRRFAAAYEQQIRMHPQNFEWSWVRDGAFERRYEVFKNRPKLFVEPFRNLVVASVPKGAVVLVASRGYQPLVELDGLNARHFPLDAGYLPRDGADAIRQLKAQRLLGATHVAFPGPEMWWLDHYPGLRDYLAHSDEVARSQAGAVYALPDVQR
jgi:lauroyl/myristoyl acyltransferase